MVRNRPLRWCTFLLGSLLLAGCASDTPKSDEGNSGSDVTVRAGRTFTISLEGNPTTGYKWEVVEYDERVLKLTGEDFSTSSDRIGAGGIQEFTFTASKSGTTTVELVHRKPWEKDVEPLRTFTANVRVNP
jgi:inhibitor of cysteine peptidase